MHFRLVIIIALLITDSMDQNCRVVASHTIVRGHQLALQTKINSTRVVMFIKNLLVRFPLLIIRPLEMKSYFMAVIIAAIAAMD